MLLWLTLLGTAVGALFVGLRYFESRSMAGQVRRGLELLARADNPAAIQAALEQWERSIQPLNAASRGSLAEHLFARYPLDDARVRLMLARLANADYGDRVEDWTRWSENYRRLSRGESPRVPAAEVVRLTEKWAAPVGLTGWFSTIMPLSGEIFVASLGDSFAGAEDQADAVVKVDGKTGAAAFFFTPPVHTGRGPRDVVGIAGGNSGLFVVSLDGNVHHVGFDGNVTWQFHLGSPAAGVPLVVDINGDNTEDVIVPTRSGQVVALSGQTGRTSWTAGLSRVPTGYPLLGTTLALADVLPGQGQELIACSPLGDVQVLNLRDGKSRWRTALATGCLAGPHVRDRTDETAGPLVQLADRAAQVWALATGRGDFESIRWNTLATVGDDTLIAGLRSIRTATPSGLLYIACPTADFESRRAAICALNGEGVTWRFPVPGAVWGTPAIADINGDSRDEIILGTIEAQADGAAKGGLYVLSSDGHCLYRARLDAPIECSPVVADVDGDNRLDVLVADQAGWLHCYSTGRAGPVRWGLAAGDARNTRNPANAFSFGQTPFHMQRQWRPSP